MKFFNLTTGKPNNEDLTEFENLLTGKFKCFKWKHTKKWAPDICIRIEIVVQQAAIIYTYSESIFFFFNLHAKYWYILSFVEDRHPNISLHKIHVQQCKHHYFT